MQIISNVALISINETLWFQMASFLIFLFIINRIMFRPLRETMQAREEHVRAVNEDITSAKDEVEAIIKQIKKEEDDARNEAFGVCDTLERSGNQEAGGIIEAARQEIAMLSDASKQKIEKLLAEARESVTHEAENLALEIMEKVLERKVV